jgi:hypothetical protein
LNITQIEEIVKKLTSDTIANEVNKDEFVYQLMTAYGHRKTTISRIKSGERNLANIEGEVRAKRHIYFKQSQSNRVLSDIDSMKQEPSVTRDKIRFVIATDFNQFVALDTRTHDTLDIEFNELGKNFDFFLPWAGMEKAIYQGENPADVKAAEKMAKLFDLIKADNFSEENRDDTAALHNLNVFLTSLLFCFFAEDTGIFTQNQFSEELESHTKLDGSDVDSYLNRLFDVLNTSKENRGDLPDYLANFEYVNGDLFANNIASPRFSTKSRRMLIECGSELDWSDINPDIFGSMIQAVVHPDQRGGMGMHYTSVTNIMKVIEPLFLDDLYAELENIEDNIDAKLIPSRLRKLHDRISEIKILDPACGSGNFLIIAFKELRKLEMEIIKRLQELGKNDLQDDIFNDTGLGSYNSRIKLSQFYGIELDDFAHEVAILSLWLAEHQMNVEFKAEFGECKATLPLSESGNIVKGNACRVDWSEICPQKNHEVYICGNPPYLGQRNQKKHHVDDMDFVFKGLKNYRNLDYIACWFLKASRYFSEKCKYAFVTTNSLCQGTLVEMLWPHILSLKQEIFFAHKNIKWVNSARDKAGVTVSIVGVREVSNEPKFFYTESIKSSVKNINPYLIVAENVIATTRKKALSFTKNIEGGNQPREGGHLILTNDEKAILLKSNPEVAKYIRPLTGSNEFLKGLKRWCIWVSETDYYDASKIVELASRFDKILTLRTNGNTVEKSFIKVPYRFVMIKEANEAQILIPVVSSERREYITAGYVDKNTIILNSANVIYDPEPHLLAIISSKIHMLWVKAVAGNLETRIRYTSGVCYNSFPYPKLDESQKRRLKELSVELLSERENYPEFSIAELYDPNKMPLSLVKIHKKIDDYMDKIYRVLSSKDEDRLSALFKLYNKMTGGQNA